MGRGIDQIMNLLKNKKGAKAAYCPKEKKEATKPKQIKRNLDVNGISTTIKKRSYTLQKSVKKPKTSCVLHTQDNKMFHIQINAALNLKCKQVTTAHYSQKPN